MDIGQEFQEFIENLREKYNAPEKPVKATITVNQDGDIIVDIKEVLTEQMINPRLIGKYRALSVNDIRKVIEEIANFIGSRGRGMIRIEWYQAEIEGWANILSEMGFMRTILGVMMFINRDPLPGSTPY